MVDMVRSRSFHPNIGPVERPGVRGSRRICGENPQRRGPVGSIATVGVLLFIHLLAVTYWVGGQLFLGFVLVPALRDEDPARRRELTRQVGIRFMNLSIPALVVIVATGVEMARRIGQLDDPTSAFNAKMACVAAAVLATAWHIVAARREQLRASAVARGIGFVASVAAVWFAVHI